MTAWLTDEEQRAWRAFLTTSQLVDEALDRQLRRDAGMPHAYYGVLTVLVEAGQAGLRMSELAERLRFSPSRLAHAVGRLERDGWVARRSCPEDGRGQTAVVTAAGRRAQAAAAPGHVAEVRARLFDQLTAADVRALERLCTKVNAAFDSPVDAAFDSPVDAAFDSPAARQPAKPRPTDPTTDDRPDHRRPTHRRPSHRRLTH